jgi:hypothetical protein
MSWWEDFYSIYNALDKAIWYIESQLESWVQNWAYWAVAMVASTYSIVNHTWSDVKNEIDNRMGSYYSSIDDFYNSLKTKLRNDFSILKKSWLDVSNYVDNKINIVNVNLNNIRSDATNLYNYAHSTLKNEISGLRTDATNLYNYAHTTLNDRINGLARDINEISGSVDGLARSAGQTVGFIALAAEKRWSILKKSYGDITDLVSGSIVALKRDYIIPQIKSLSQDIDAITDDVEGITRSAKHTIWFIASEAEKRWSILKKSYDDITDLVSDSLDTLRVTVILPIASNLSTLTTRVDYLVNTTLVSINKRIESLLSNIERLKVEHVFPMRIELTGLVTSFNALPGWVNQTFAKHANDLIEQFIKVFAASEKTSVRFLQALGIGAGEIITTILDTPADMVAWIQDAIADVFEEILDRVFR